MSLADSILTFWASAGPEKWWKKDVGFDEQIRHQFLSAHNDAVDGAYDRWETENPDKALALVLLLDQFSRNLHRDSAKAYANDEKVVAMVHRIIARGDDRKMPDDIAEFIYLPLMHWESLPEQNLCVAEMRRLNNKAGIKAAVEHRDIILRFGRFPHRNKVLGRASSEEENRFLERGGFSG